MEPLLSKLLDQLNSSVFVLLGILGVTFLAIYRIGKMVQRFSHQDEKINKLENLAEKVVVLMTKVDLIYDNTNPRSVARATSPITWTDLGKEISAKIQANTIFQKYQPRLTVEVESKNPQNAYDIQMESMKAAKEQLPRMLDEGDLVAIKQEAYNRGIIVDDVMTIFGLLLRNQILNQKGLPISDVDVHAKGRVQ